MSRKMLRNILEEAGFAVVGEASDGIEGVLAYKQFSPDVITLDITMPNMDGTEALKQIKDYDEDEKGIVLCVFASRFRWDDVFLFRRQDRCEEVGR